jgi:hypothetical protein
MAEIKLDDFSAKHPHLYHYTTESGFRGIVSSNSLWATYFRDLNDSTEIMHLKEPLKQVLSKELVVQFRKYRSSGPAARKIVVQNGGAESMAKKLAFGWVNSLYATTFEMEDEKRTTFCGIASFCSHVNDQEYERENGLLSQWRGYGRQGGYCLVFDTLAMKNLIDHEMSSYFYIYANLCVVRYLFRPELVTEYFRELIKVSEEIVKARVVDDSNIGALASQSFIPFVSSAATTKHRGFYEEREIRLVAMPATNLADAEIKGKPGYKLMPIKPELALECNGCARRYISLFGRGFEKLPLVKVIVGPSREQKANIRLARELVRNTVPVIASETPYLD